MWVQESRVGLENHASVDNYTITCVAEPTHSRSETVFKFCSKTEGAFSSPKGATEDYLNCVKDLVNLRSVSDVAPLLAPHKVNVRDSVLTPKAAVVLPGLTPASVLQAEAAVTQPLG